METEIKDKAKQLGFDACRITSAMPIDSKDKILFELWANSGLAADLRYMLRNTEKRISDQQLLKGGQSVICLALAYDKVDPPQDSECFISSYACYEDYHNTIKTKLFALAEFIQDTAQKKVKFKACVDSVPLCERSYARKAGLGFVGKNRMLINPALGSRIFLGELITDLRLLADSPVAGDCGDCRKCIEACPVGAISDRGVDCRKCLSSLTIESNLPLPAEYASAAAGSVFGCDRCVDVCPFNNRAKSSQLKPIIKSGYKIREITDLTEPDFNAKFQNTPVSRVNLEKLKQNALLAESSR